MFCPGCGASQSEDLKFCKACGTNLSAVRQAVTTGEMHPKFDWSKTWVAEMFLTEDEQNLRKEMLERQRGITPLMRSEAKRHNEMKGGVITACVGLGVMIFLNIFFRGLVASGDLPHDAIEIVSRIWIVGVIPFFIGLGLIINGAMISKRLVDISRRELLGSERQRMLDAGRSTQGNLSNPATGSTDSLPPKFGVTEQTTRELRRD
ncbi:MAG TPA: hypothetical protein VI756_26670 [Blastocatellia bacterium]